MGGYQWGSIDLDEMSRAVAEALDQGIRFFDTADCYGRGESEVRLARFLGRRREEVQLCTKFGVRIDSEGKRFYDCRPEWLEEALNASLKRLNTDYIDLYLIHYHDGETPWELVFEKLDRKVQEGKIRGYGASNLKWNNLPKKLPSRFVSLQCEFSLSQRSSESFAREYCDSHALVPSLYGCLGQGVLTGKYSRSPVDADDRRSSPRYLNFHGEKLDRNLRIVEVMRPMAAKYGCPLAAIAYRFVMARFPQGITLGGIKNREQLRALTIAPQINLTHIELEALNRASA